MPHALHPQTPLLLSLYGASAHTGASVFGAFSPFFPYLSNGFLFLPLFPCAHTYTRAHTLLSFYFSQIYTYYVYEDAYRRVSSWVEGGEVGWRGRERGPETRYTTRRGARSGPGRGRAIPSLGSAPHSRVPAPLGGTGGINVHVYVSLPGVYVSLSGPPAQSRYSFDQLTIQPSSLSCDCA